MSAQIVKKLINVGSVYESIDETSTSTFCLNPPADENNFFKKAFSIVRIKNIPICKVFVKENFQELHNFKFFICIKILCTSPL